MSKHFQVYYFDLKVKPLCGDGAKNNFRPIYTIVPVDDEIHQSGLIIQLDK